MARNKLLIIWGGVIAVVLAVSILSFFYLDNKFLHRAVFFPNERTLELEGEMRRVPRRRDTEENVYLLVRELLLGPSDISHARLTPKTTDVQSVLLRGDVLYLDFSQDILFEDRQRPVPFDLVVTGIKKTVSYNYPRIENVIISVGGVPVDSENRY